MGSRVRHQHKRFYSILFLILGCLLLVEVLLIPSRPLLEKKVDVLTPLQEKQLSLFLEQNKLLTSLATLVAGAVGGLVLNRGKGEKLAPGDLRRAIASWLLLGVSLYCGHLAQANLVWMLDKQFFNLYNTYVVWPTKLQFWTFLGAIIITADFIFSGLNREEV
jgi:hypothetical protein